MLSRVSVPLMPSLNVHYNHYFLLNDYGVGCDISQESWKGLQFVSTKVLDFDGGIPNTLRSIWCWRLCVCVSVCVWRHQIIAHSVHV